MTFIYGGLHRRGTVIVYANPGGKIHAALRKITFLPRKFTRETIYLVFQFESKIEIFNQSFEMVNPLGHF